MKRTCAFISGSLLLMFLTSLSFAQDTRIHTAPGLGDYEVPFYPTGTYRSDVQSPEAFLGFKIGARPLTHEEVLSYLSYLDDVCPNAELHDYGETCEGRRLAYLTITSEENAKNLSTIRERIATLADPRRLENEAQARRIIEETPAVAWMAYSIHGDELSSTDASVQLAYQLLAGTDETSRRIREALVVCIDPLQNPDGRMRWIAQLKQWSSAVPNTDIQSLHHRGTWPRGRGNHYLFDLNRDWFTLVNRETRGKVQAMLDWHPQFVVDSHEMGPTATYLFSPPREPFNPFMIRQIHKWWKIIAEDQAAAFDTYGWSYYTREWNEELFPGYGSSWCIYTGAIGMLYEQAGVDGSQVKRPDDTIMTYRETVHHQFVSSLSNLTTVATHRRELLEDFYSEKKRAVGAKVGKRAKGTGRSAAFLFPPDANESRLIRFAETLRQQSIEIEVAKDPFKVSHAQSHTGEKTRSLSLPEGTLIVRLDQPMRHLIQTILAFDIRLATDFLEVERKELLKRNSSKLYEVTAWSLPLAYNLTAYYAEALPRIETESFQSPSRHGGIKGEPAAYGYVFSTTDDRSYRVLARLLERGYKVCCAKRPFETAGKHFPRGSCLIRLSANPNLDVSDLEEIAEGEGTEIYGVSTALATSGADLGGNEFVLLEAPRIAIVGGSGISTASFSTVWHLLDAWLGLRASTLEATGIHNTDLDKYNLLVLPSMRGEHEAYRRLLGDAGTSKIKAWVEEGGTLVALGTAAAFLADTSTALGSLRLKRHVLDRLKVYQSTLDAKKEADAPTVDSLDVWEAKPNQAPDAESTEEKSKPDLEMFKQADEKARKLFPRGAILATDIDEEHWLAFGCKSSVPVLVRTSYAYLAKGDVQVAARFAEERQLRLSGLLWPEARERWSETAYATRESCGKGQVILFATQPNFRGFFHGGERMLLNALLLGPGFGTRRSIEW